MEHRKWNKMALGPMKIYWASITVRDGKMWYTQRNLFSLSDWQRSKSLLLPCIGKSGRSRPMEFKLEFKWKQFLCHCDNFVNQ